jgi:GNAT superfamily N-acetyltransferase
MEGARRAIAADVATLVALVEAEHAELAIQRGGALWVAHAPAATVERLDAALHAPDAVVVAGTFDDVVLGVASARVIVAPGVGSVATLEDLYVDPEAREVGIGAALLDEVMCWAQAVGCVGIDSSVLPGSRAAKNFFEAHGLVARAITVHHRFATEELVAGASNEEGT